IDAEFRDFWNLLFVFFLGDMDWPARWIEQADQIFSGRSLNPHAPRLKILRVKAARVLDADKTFVIDVLDVKADLVDVTGEDDFLRAGRFGFFHRDQRA